EVASRPGGRIASRSLAFDQLLRRLYSLGCLASHGCTGFAYNGIIGATGTTPVVVELEPLEEPPVVGDVGAGVFPRAAARRFLASWRSASFSASTETPDFAA